MARAASAQRAPSDGRAARRAAAGGFPRAVRLRLRELARRPVVGGLLLLAGAAVLALELGAAYGTRAGAAVPDGAVIWRGLRVGAAPVGLLFGVLATVVVGTELASGIERVLLARDPRRARLVRLELTVVLLAGVGWAAWTGAVAVGAGLLVHALGGAGPLLGAGPGTLVRALAGLLAATLVYGLLGSASAFLFGGAVAGVVGLLVYGVLAELALAPLWHPATRWTVFEGATLLAGGPHAGLGRATVVLVVAAAASGLICFAAYSGREIRS